MPWGMIVATGGVLATSAQHHAMPTTQLYIRLGMKSARPTLSVRKSERCEGCAYENLRFYDQGEVAVFRHVEQFTHSQCRRIQLRCWTWFCTGTTPEPIPPLRDALLEILLAKAAMHINLPPPNEHARNQSVP
eukprot:6492738-Amphidinium_carterae.1